MSRPLPSGMSGAGFAVVVSLCLALLGAVATLCALALRGEETPEALDRLVQALLVGVPALLANTRRSPGSDAPPVTTPDDPLYVEEVDSARDAGVSDVGLALVVLFVLVLLLLLGVLPTLR